jgi:hypothetical protein
MIDKLLMKNENYKNKIEEVERLKNNIEILKKDIGNLNIELDRRNKKIKELSEQVEIREKFRFICCMVIQMKKFEEKLPRISKKERNEILWHDSNKIYISREKLNDFIDDEQIGESKSTILEYLRLMNVVESEGDRFTKKVSINGKYKRMVILNREVMRKYLNMTYYK